MLDHLLVYLNENNLKSTAYISAWKYRSSITGDERISYFEKSALTRLSAFNKRLNQICYMIAATFKLLFSRSRLNVFYTQPPLFVIWAAWMSRIRGIPYIIHVQDLYPDILGKLAYLDEDKRTYKWLDKKMTQAILKAEKVIVLGVCMVDKLLEKDIPESHIVKVINIPAATDKQPPTGELAKLGIHDKFTMLYAGNMGMAHEFETILQVAGALEKSHPEIHFLFVAQGRRRPLAETYLEEGHKNLTLINYPAHEVFMSLLQETDLHYITLKHDFQGVMVPCKFYSSLAIGKPIIYEGAITSELGVEIKSHDLGSAISHTDSAGLSAAILKYYTDPQLLQTSGQKVAQYYQTVCDKQTIIQNCAKVLMDAL